MSKCHTCLFRKFPLFICQQEKFLKCFFNLSQFPRGKGKTVNPFPQEIIGCSDLIA